MAKTQKVESPSKDSTVTKEQVQIELTKVHQAYKVEIAKRDVIISHLDNKNNALVLKVNQLNEEITSKNNALNKK